MEIDLLENYKHLSFTHFQKSQKTVKIRAEKIVSQNVPTLVFRPDWLSLLGSLIFQSHGPLGA